MKVKGKKYMVMVSLTLEDGGDIACAKDVEEMVIRAVDKAGYVVDVAAKVTIDVEIDIEV